jgi:peptidyl-prolyl cis-trans isomerase C
MNKTSKTLILSILFAPFLFFPPAVRAEDLAKVNGVPITSEEFSSRMHSMSREGSGRFDSPEEKEELLNIMISREVLAQEAKRAGLEKQKEVQEKIRNLSQEVLISAMVDRIATQRLTEPNMKGFYEKNRDSFREVHASHILVGTEQEAKDLKEKLDKGADFAELAKKFSKDPGSAEQGGDLGFFTQERMVKSFSEAAFALKVNEVSGPVKSPFGYHLIKTLETRPAKKFEELGPPDIQALKNEMINKEIEKLKEGSKIEVRRELLQKVQ